jgi:8-oxo-dGTP pyrophosphatase MutT (NUDIX family)
MADTDGNNIWEIEISERLRKVIENHLVTPVAVPAQPRYAATVMLVRDAVNEKGLLDEVTRVETFMLRRAKTMAFVPDALVFPGGRVDVRDAACDLRWIGPSPSEWASRMHCSEEIARQVVVAAAREVFEECNVLLAGADASSVLDDLTDSVWDQERERLLSREESFSSMLIQQGLVFRSDLLGLRSHWLTPEFEPRRYDTFFFAALLPAGQLPSNKTSEASDARWVDPRWLLDKAERAGITLLPPTRYNLTFLADAKDAELFVRETPPVQQIMLKPHWRDDGELVLRCVLP